MHICSYNFLFKLQGQGINICNSWLGQHWSRKWLAACSAPRQFTRINVVLLFVMICRNKIQWNLNQDILGTVRLWHVYPLYAEFAFSIILQIGMTQAVEILPHGRQAPCFLHWQNMAAADLATDGARASLAMFLTSVSWVILATSAGLLFPEVSDYLSTNWCIVIF